MALKLKLHLPYKGTLTVADLRAILDRLPPATAVRVAGEAWQGYYWSARRVVHAEARHGELILWGITDDPDGRKDDEE